MARGMGQVVRAWVSLPPPHLRHVRDVLPRQPGRQRFPERDVSF